MITGVRWIPLASNEKGLQRSVDLKKRASNGTVAANAFNSNLIR